MFLGVLGVFAVTIFSREDAKDAKIIPIQIGKLFSTRC
jgi:hypothetical protein